MKQLTFNRKSAVKNNFKGTFVLFGFLKSIVNCQWSMVVGAKRRQGQLMLISVFILGSVILGTTMIAGLIMTYRLRQVADVKDSARAIFAADAGLERALFQCFKLGIPTTTCANFSGSLTNGASYTVIYNGGTPQEIRSLGAAGRASRALRFRF